MLGITSSNKHQFSTKYPTNVQINKKIRGKCCFCQRIRRPASTDLMNLFTYVQHRRKRMVPILRRLRIQNRCALRITISAFNSVFIARLFYTLDIRCFERERLPDAIRLDVITHISFTRSSCILTNSSFSSSSNLELWVAPRESGSDSLGLRNFSGYSR